MTPTRGAAASPLMGCGWEPPPHAWVMLENGTLAPDRRAYGTHKLIRASFQKLTSQNSTPEAVLGAASEDCAAAQPHQTHAAAGSKSWG